MKYANLRAELLKRMSQHADRKVRDAEAENNELVLGGLSDDELITEFGAEFASTDRVVGDAEAENNEQALGGLRAELLRRMAQPVDTGKVG